MKTATKFALGKLNVLIASAGPRALVAILVLIHVIAIAVLAVPMLNTVAISSASSLGHLAWSQLSTPGPPTPAGDITMKLMGIWWNHVREVEIPRLAKFWVGINGSGWQKLWLACRSSLDGARICTSRGRDASDRATCVIW